LARPCINRDRSALQKQWWSARPLLLAKTLPSAATYACYPHGDRDKLPQVATKVVQRIEHRCSHLLSNLSIYRVIFKTKQTDTAVLDLRIFFEKLRAARWNFVQYVALQWPELYKKNNSVSAKAQSMKN